MPSTLRALVLVLCLSPLAAHADTLADIYELALKNDPVLKVAEARYRAAREVLPQARAGLLPTVQGSAEFSTADQDERSSNPFILGGTPFISESRYNRDSDREYYSVTLTQPLFDLSAWFTYQQGQELNQQAAARLSSDQQDVIVRVAEAYFNVLRAKDNLASSRAQERAFQRQLDQTQQRFEVGLIAITDVHEARAAYDAAHVQRLSDEGNLGIAYEGLTVLTGKAHANLWELSEDFPVTPPTPEDRSEWVAFSLNNNFDLKAAWYAAQAAYQNAQAQKARHLPTVTGGLSYSDEDIDGEVNDLANLQKNPFENETEGETLFVSVELPLFTGGALSSRRRQAYEEYNQAREDHTRVHRNTIQATRSLHLAVVTDAQRVKARRQAIVSAQSSLDATQAGYDVGTRNVVDVLQAQRQLYSSIRDYANARYDYVLNQLRLKKQAGTLSPQDIYALNDWLVAPEAPTLNGHTDTGSSDTK